MILHFESDCATARLEGRVPVQVLDAVDAALTYTEAGAYFSPAYKLGHWDGKRKLFDRKRQEFPAGLEDRILSVLEKMIPDFDVIDERPIIVGGNVQTVELNGVTLYDEQREALQKFFDAGARGCMELPTGFGKTEIAAAVLKMTPGSALVLIDSKSLVAQTAQRLKQRLGEKVGVFGGGEKNTSHRITVATIQAVWHHFAKLRKSFLPGIQTLIVDEAHKVSPKMWFNVLGEVGASVRLGLSATIREASRRMVVESYLGPIVHSASVKEMIEDGRSAKPTIRMLRLGGLVRATDPQTVYEEGVVRNAVRNRLICEAAARCIIDGNAPLILVVRIEHGQVLRDMLEDRGIYLPFLHGQTEMDTIQRAKKRFGTSEIPGIIACITGDTKIKLLDGRSVSVKSLVGQSGFHTYSLNAKTGHIVPGLVQAVVRSGRRVPIFKVQIKGWKGKIYSVRCTENHRFMMRDGTYKMCRDLVSNDSLMPCEFYTTSWGYVSAWNPRTKTLTSAHKEIALAAYGARTYGHVVHHKNFVPEDNRPENLEWLTEEQHKKLHENLGFIALWKNAKWRRWKTAENLKQAIRRWKKPEQRKLVSAHFKTFWASMTAEQRKQFCREQNQWTRTSRGRRYMKEQMTKYNRSAAHVTAIKTAHKNGRYNRAYTLTAKRNKTIEHRKKVSIGLKRAWRDGTFTGFTGRKHHNHSVISVISCGKADVFDLQVSDTQNFATEHGVWLHNSTIFDMGQDMPGVNVLILAGGQRSPLRTIQRVGRALRKKLTGENTVRILDIYDMSQRMLQSQSDERLRTYKKKYGDVKLIHTLDDLFPNPTTPRTRQPVA